MKAYLIKASAPGPFKEYKKYMGAPPQNIFSMAACTPRHVEIDMCDETADMRPNLRTDADVVVLLFHTPDAPHTYELAAKFRAKGKTVVLGGLHASAMPDEAQKHCDALLIGEAEGIWEQLLEDLQAGKLKKRYQRTGPVDMAALNPYPTDIIPPSRYNGVWSVLVSRGCVHRCEYCVIPPFFRGKYRLRPVEDVVAEIKAAPATWFELHADNLTADRDYAIKLFKALKPLNISWMGESTIRMADDEELLRLAGESGCKYLLIGIETPSQAALDKSGKGITTPEDVRDRIRRFHAHGIKITSSMIFGFDTHTKDIFRESLDFSQQIEIDEVESVLLAPFPGTPLYKRFKEEGRILTEDWSKYDCANVVFRPKNMTVEELDQGSYWFWKQINKSSVFSLFSYSSDSPFDEGGKGDAAGEKTPAPSNSIGRGNMGMFLGSGDLKWRTLLALVGIAASVALNQYWIWGLIFLFWAVRDIRNKATYLVEPLERAHNPVLYWVVVVMWLLFGLWALSQAPIIERFAQPAVAESVVNTPLPESPAAEPARTVRRAVAAPENPASQPEPATQSVVEPSSGMKIEIPKTWKVSKYPTASGRQVNMEEGEGHATLTYITFDMGKKITLGQFIEVMETDLRSDLPMVVKNGGRISSVKPSGESGVKMTFKEYTGRMDGQSVTSIIGYGVRKKRGYLVIAVHGENDNQTREVVLKSMAGMVLEKG